MLEAKIRTLTHTPLIFKPFEAVVAESHQEHLTQISHQLVEISRAAQALNFSVHFNITGYSSVREYAQNGMATSQQRAEAFRDFLTFRGIHPDSIHIKAMGKSPPTVDTIPPYSAVLSIDLSESPSHPTPSSQSSAAGHSDTPQDHSSSHPPADNHLAAPDHH
ncbi:MAG: OmpA family protein [Verrucomicrobia bacterium]|nr:OmpA family protein [Verrucomicrobiota bacterium]